MCAINSEGHMLKLFKHMSLGAMTLVVAACSNSVESQVEIPKSEVIIYSADTVLTLNNDTPSARAVATENGLIVGTGTLEGLKTTYKGAQIDRTFEGQVIVPGLIDPHIHMTLGSMMYGLDFVPPWNMETPKGFVEGVEGKNAFLERVAEFEAETPAGQPLFLFGYHNLVHGDIDRYDLDTISKDRPIFIWHYSGHDFYLNSSAITLAKLTPALSEKFHGIALDDNGELTGRIYEDASPALFPTIAPIIMSPAHIKKGWTGYETLLQRSGVTTVADMAYGIFGLPMEDGYRAQHYTDSDAYRLYLVPEFRAFTAAFGEDAPSTMLEMSTNFEGPAKVLPQVKIFTDAAFYSQTMRLMEPGYTGGQSKGTKGLWVTEPDVLTDTMRPYWEAGLDIHIHSNGDAAQTATLEAFKTMRADMPNPDQRLIIEHAGLMRPDHTQAIAELGGGVSAASHYVHYMGKDYEAAIGDRVKYISPLRSVLRAGALVTLHSDAPLAPPQPLIAASVHMTRSTRQGGVSTPSERLTAEQALRAITLDAAWSLGLEEEIGSIEAGKRADFTILDRNPLETPAQDWPEIKVWGVVLNGKLHPVN